jgi:hypothetical protein
MQVSQIGPPHGSGELIVEWLDRHPLPDRLTRTPAQLEAQITAEREGWE